MQGSKHLVLLNYIIIRGLILSFMFLSLKIQSTFFLHNLRSYIAVGVCGVSICTEIQHQTYNTPEEEVTSCCYG